MVYLTFSLILNIGVLYSSNSSYKDLSPNKIMSGNIYFVIITNQS